MTGWCFWYDRNGRVVWWRQGNVDHLAWAVACFTAGVWVEMLSISPGMAALALLSLWNGK